MKRNLLIILIALAAVIGLGVYFGWAVEASSELGGGWGDLMPVWPIVAAGALMVGALTGGLMWLAFYSARRGYDDQSQDR